MAQSPAIPFTSITDLPTLTLWQTQQRKPVYKNHLWVTIEEHQVHIPAQSDARPSKTIPDWAYIVSGHWVNVAIHTKEDRWIVFHQTKYGIGVELQTNSLACVGGYIDPNEDPLVAAKRECLEEAGYASWEWEALGSSVSNANRGDGVGHLFVCFGAEYTGHTTSDDLEQQIMLSMTTEQLEDALLQNQFRCQGWVACLSMALLQYRRRQRLMENIG